MAKKKIAFAATVVDEDGVAVVHKLAVRPPSADVRTQATMHRLAVYGEAVGRRIMVKQELETHLRRMNLWDDEKERAFRLLRDLLVEKQGVLARGGVKKSEAREAAIQARGARRMIEDLTSPRLVIERNTADALADQAQFEYLVAHCTTHDDGPREGLPYFTIDGVHPSLEAYRERAVEDDGGAAAGAFADLYYGEVAEAPEDAFLKKYGFADAQGRLVDAQGRLVDADGALVDEEGYLLGADAEPEFVEFLDDDEPEAEAETPADDEDAAPAETPADA